ncbi:hypothetical protein C2W64_00679 [Brevibacillus laterosporus]|nr:hypothetical protein C2W64_00679 [Brevibacillus laterosporus]
MIGIYRISIFGTSNLLMRLKNREMNILIKEKTGYFVILSDHLYMQKYFKR